MLFPKPKLVDIVSLAGYKSEVTTRDPFLSVPWSSSRVASGPARAGIRSGSEVAVEVSAVANFHRTFRQYAQHDTDRTLTYHCNRLSSLQAEPFDALHAGVDRLQKTGLFEGNVGGMRTVPWRTIQSITRTYSAKPPPEGSNPAVQPTFL